MYIMYNYLIIYIYIYTIFVASVVSYVFFLYINIVYINGVGASRDGDPILEPNSNPNHLIIPNLKSDLDSN